MRTTIRNLTPQDVARGLKDGSLVLIDVREPNETARERIPGSLCHPLSTFDPAALSAAAGRTLVFSCASGIRSVRAAEIARAHGLACDAHLAGGIAAWKAAGLPIER